MRLQDLSPAVRAKVASLGPVVTADELDAFSKITEVNDKSAKLRTILNAWEVQQRQERDLRRFYAKWFLIGLGVQVGLLNCAFFLHGFGVMTVDAGVAKAFIIAAFTEICALTVLVTKYLFQKSTLAPSDLLDKS